MKNAPTEEHIRRLREGLRDHHLEATMTLALVTGIRCDELRHLTWSEIDLEKREMHVLNRKTKSNSRLIHLSEACAQALKQHHLRQMKQKSEANTARTHLDLVFPDGMGALLSRQLFLEQWDDLLTQAGLPHLCFHDLRVRVWRRLLHEHAREAREEHDGVQERSRNLDKHTNGHQLPHRMTAKKQGATQMSREITIRHIRALAGKRGYRVIVEKSHIHVIKKYDEQIRRSFALHEPFEIDPPFTEQFTFLCIYLWIRGYDLTSREHEMVRIERAMHHPKWNPRQPREKQFAYQDFYRFLCDIASWVQYLETHHCPFLERLSLQEELRAAPSSHDLAPQR